MSGDSLPHPKPRAEDFQATDWIERLAAALAGFLADPRLRYAHGVQLSVVDGELCMVVASWLEEGNPETHADVVRFAEAHELSILKDRRTGDRALPHPA